MNRTTKEPAVSDLFGDVLGPLDITDHCVMRFGQRVRPALRPGAIRAEIRRLVATGELHADPPGWYEDLGDHGTTAYVYLGPDVIIALLAVPGRRTVARTCLVRGAMRRAAVAAARPAPGSWVRSDRPGRRLPYKRLRRHELERLSLEEQPL